MRAAVYRRAHFNAAHRLHNAKWSDERNREVFGPCNNANFHGHNYELEVCVKGNVNPDTGYVMDLGVLKQIIKEEVEDRFDHKNLNLDVPDFQDRMPSAEHIAAAIYDYLLPRLPAGLELSLKLWETPRNAVGYPV